MIPIRFEWGQRPIGKVNLARMRRLANEAAGDYWHGHFLYRHWASGAAHRYGYQPRTSQYIHRKIRQAARGRVLAGGMVPLLYTGEMRRLLTGTKINRAMPSHILVRMIGPRYMTMRPWKSGRPPLGDEATRVVPDELAKLAEIYARRAGELLTIFFQGREA